jgi:MoxR-like ATPase
VLTRDELLSVRSVVREIPVARHVQDYAVRLLEATHRERPGASMLVKRYVRYGASPRGAQACLLAAKARALIAGRVHVAVEDVRAVALAALRHRVILSFEGEAEGITTDQVLTETLAAVPESI